MSRGRQDKFHRIGGDTGVFSDKTAVRPPLIKWKRFIVLSFLFLVFVYAIITGVMSMSYAGEIIHPPIAPVMPINKNLGYPHTSVSFKSRDETVQLYGWHFNAKKTPNILIIAHGFGGNRFPFGGETPELIEAVISAGFNVLVFDLRNSGGSGSSISTFGYHEKYDVLGAIDYLRAAGYENIAILGISTGANAAAMAAAEAPMEDVGALILDSPVVDTGRFIMRLVREKKPNLPEFPFDFEVPLLAGVYINGSVGDIDAGVNLKKFMPRPVQIIYGTNDDITSLADITELYNGYMSGAVGKISIWNVPGAGHAGCFDYARDEYLERVTAFLTRVFEP